MWAGSGLWGALILYLQCTIWITAVDLALFCCCCLSCCCTAHLSVERGKGSVRFNGCACQIKQHPEFLTPSQILPSLELWRHCGCVWPAPLGSTHFTYMIICIRCFVSATCKLWFCCSVLHFQHLSHVCPSWQRDPYSVALPEVFRSFFFFPLLKRFFFFFFFNPHGKFFLPWINRVILEFWAI